MCACVSMCMCVCVCVCERASEQPRERGVCVCVCLSERPRERVRFFEIFDMNALKTDLPPLKRAMALYQ